MANWKKLLWGEWNWKRPIKSLTFIYLCLFLVALGCANKLIYHPPVSGYTAESPQISTITSEDGNTIGILYLSAKKGMPTLLWSHGNAEDIGYLSPRFQDFHAKGYGILAYDYPGYGISTGTPNEKGCYHASEAAWKHLTKTLSTAPKNIIIYGQSVGSGPACWLARKHDCAGLILVSPLTSAFRTVTRIPIFLGDQYPNIKRIPKIKTPLLVIHGDQDKVVHQRNGKEIYNLHSGPKQFLNIQGAGHNNLYIVGKTEIFKAIEDFWKKHH